MFLDECHFYQRGTRIGTWYPPEDRDPFVFQEPGRKGISVFGALSINDGKLFTKITEKYNSMTFLEFLCIVHGKFPNSMVVLDNALYHHASVVTEFAFLTGMDLLFLPPYSPELNPIERVWKLVRKHATHNRYFEMLSNLSGALRNEFNRYIRPNEELKKLCVIN